MTFGESHAATAGTVSADWNINGELHDSNGTTFDIHMGISDYRYDEEIANAVFQAIVTAIASVPGVTVSQAYRQYMARQDVTADV